MYASSIVNPIHFVESEHQIFSPRPLFYVEHMRKHSSGLYSKEYG